MILHGLLNACAHFLLYYSLGWLQRISVIHEHHLPTLYMVHNFYSLSISSSQLYIRFIQKASTTFNRFLCHFFSYSTLNPNSLKSHYNHELLQKHNNVIVDLNKLTFPNRKNHPLLCKLHTKITYSFRTVTTFKVWP